MKKVLMIAVIFFTMAASARAQIGLGLGYNLSSEGQALEIDFEFINGHSQFGVEGDIFFNERFEIKVHAGPIFSVGNKMSISPLLEFGYRHPKIPVFGGSLMWIYNPYKEICLFAKIQYIGAVNIVEKQVSVSSGMSGSVGLIILNVF